VAGGTGTKQRKSRVSMAQRADRHILYEKSVQCPEAEIDFIDDTFTKLRRRRARVLREDFCGTAAVSCEWVRRRARNEAIGVDLDPAVLDWSRRNKIPRLTPQQARRLHLLNDNVLRAQCDPADALLAMNFSYWIFKDRSTMKRYFRRVHRGLVDDGIFFLDAFGGYEAFKLLEESTDYNGHVYVWDQDRYNPVTGDITCYIHFRFKDGSRMRKAFTYEWRLWTLPELLEMLHETGFEPTVYMEGADEKGEGNGEFSPVTEADADAGWLAYIVAEKL
jgi:cyclopropane fatty-acyl-phospholipid synthase-like methyltransferase